MSTISARFPSVRIDILHWGWSLEIGSERKQSLSLFFDSIRLLKKKKSDFKSNRCEKIRISKMPAQKRHALNLLFQEHIAQSGIVTEQEMGDFYVWEFLLLV